jgi:hypothetical protein
MIDWFHVAANALWILGCSLALGTLSYASWRTVVEPEKLRVVLAKKVYQIALNLAGLLFCAGLAATSSSILQTGLWAALGILFLIQVILNLRRLKPAAQPAAQDQNPPASQTTLD